MLFNFRLFPLETIKPWRSGGESYLHWFGLTDGCYWLRAGNAELFRYGEQYLSVQVAKHGCEPYVCYNVSRLWEDIVQMLPAILTPIPQAFADQLTASGLITWRERAAHWLEHREDDQSIALYVQATEWLQGHHLGTGYLNNAPTIYFWSDGRRVHIEWDNRDQQKDGVPIWGAEFGTWSLSVQTFLAEVQSFNAQFIEAMQGRVELIRAGSALPNLVVDQDQLIVEQAQRSTWLEKSLSKAFQQPAYDWTETLEAIALIEADF